MQLALFMLVGAALAMQTAAMLPIWTLWHENPMEGLGSLHSL
jgi:hypothetical protein